MAVVCAGGVQIVSVEVAISSGVLKFSVDMLRWFQCWLKQYLAMVGGGVDFLEGEETFDEGPALFLQELWLSTEGFIFVK